MTRKPFPLAASLAALALLHVWGCDDTAVLNPVPKADASADAHTDAPADAPSLPDSSGGPDAAAPTADAATPRADASAGG